VNIGGDYVIGRSVRSCVHVHDNSASSKLHINLPLLQRNGSSFCLPFRQNGGALLWKLLHWRRYAHSRAPFSSFIHSVT